MTEITFLQLRPADAVNEIWASTRRREGTLTVEVATPLPSDVVDAQKGGLLLASGDASVDAPVYVIEPSRAKILAKRRVKGWRVTILDSDSRIEVLDALSFTRARYLRTNRSSVADAAELVSLPGSEAAVSVFVDTVADALEAVEAGARDLLLRDWDTERIGELRDALGLPLIERGPFPIDVEYDDAATELEKGAFSAYLNQIDGSGRARPRVEWAPGKDLDTPQPDTRVSAAWPDDAWRGRSPATVEDASVEIRGILERALAGSAPSVGEIETLFRAHGTDVETIADAADVLRRQAVGDDVTFVVNRNINYTNQCYFKCGFCAFSKGPRSLDLRGEPYLLSIDEVVERSSEAWDRGATEVCLQGGIHPDFTGQFYIDVVSAIKARVPNMHIHGFTPLEVWQGAETAGVTVRELLVALNDAGLGTLPGTAAEILDDDVRLTLCPDKIRTAQWAEVMLTAHDIGLRTTSTMMFGHVDGPRSWANHIEVLREIQRRTGGFTEFVPLPFVHMGSPIWLRGQSRPGPTWDEVILVHAVSRIAFIGLIDNIQASWVKLGLDGAAVLLRSGCNDVGGTLMDESISRAAGASHGTEVSAADFRDAILDLDRNPVRRNTVYQPIESGIVI
ncbi:MAG: 7,8-didemethyl-8-hydroxy-5-deazariboflavin synthase subunit CofH [Armatimonadetes bacterium]|nr:MAG: 7,8-didemethyl-8-hydroxy-5-deazariboflavin synthase subunit CofH [Armatimonadota bacterium]